MTRRTQIRRGATLVEMLVAAAMSIMIMWLLTWCYQQGLASFSNTKSHADLMDQERMVTTVLTRDLVADHFLTEDGKPNGGRQVRDQWLYTTGYTPPKYGFFYAYSPMGTAFVEPTDPDGFSSTISTDHILQFSTILPGGPPEQMFNADVPFGTATPLFGRAAVVSYYLVPAGSTLGGTPLHHLIRRQQLCALTTDDKPTYDQKINPVQPADAAEVMAVTPVAGANPPNVPTIFTLNNLTNPANRLLVPTTPLTARPQLLTRLGEDILMSNVVSFEVKFTGLGTGWPRTIANGNADWPYDNLPGNGTFDTAGTAGAAKIRITGALIRVRANDPKTRTTRQTTIIVAL